MRALILSTLLLVTGFAGAQGIAPTIEPKSFKFGRFGDVAVYGGTSVRHIAIYFSDAAGLDAADRQTAQRLAAQNVLVAAIDLRHYASELGKPREKCSYLAGEFEDFSHELQKHFSPRRYHMPVLIGRGRAAGLVYGVTAQGSSGTFVGAVTLGFDPTWDPLVKLCQSYGLRYDMQSKLVKFKPAEQLSTPWIDVPARETTPSQALKQFIAATGTAKSKADRSEASILASVDEVAKKDLEPVVRADELRDLPLEEVRASGPRTNRFAVFLTGDGGWAEIDKGVSAELAKQGVDVVALSSLQYFWKPRSPDETAKDVARILRHYSTAWNKSEALIIGYSFGADVAPFAVNRLPADLRSKIVSVSLLGLAEQADFEVHVTTWLGADHHGVPIQPEIARMKEKVLCIYGKGEDDSLCPALGKLQASPAFTAHVDVAQIGDGHHFGDQYNQLAQRILAHSR